MKRFKQITGWVIFLGVIFGMFYLVLPHPVPYDVWKGTIIITLIVGLFTTSMICRMYGQLNGSRTLIIIANILIAPYILFFVGGILFVVISAIVIAPVEIFATITVACIILFSIWLITS